MFIGTALTAVSALLTAVILAKHTTTEVFGNYSSIIATIAILTPMCGFGIAQYWLKIFGQHGDYGVLWIKQSIIFIVASTSVIFLILSAWFSLVSDSNDLVLPSILLAFIIFKSVSTEIINSTLQIEGRYLFLALWQLLQSYMFLMSVAIFIYIFDITLNELTISLIHTPTVILAVIIAFFVLKKFVLTRNGAINQVTAIEISKQEKPNIVNIFKQSAPFGFAGLFSLVYSQIGLVFVSKIIGAEAAAHYSVALTFFLAAMLVPITIYQKYLLPKLHKWAFHDREKFEKSYYIGNKVMLGFGMLVSGFMWIFSSYFVELFFGQKYFDSIYLVQLLAINIPIVYIASNAGSLLVTKNHMKIKVYYMGVAAIVCTFLMGPMILNFGTVGAIYSTTISNVIILLLYYYKVKTAILVKKKD